MNQIHVFFSGLCWQYVCYYRMSNLDERRNSTKSITQKIMLCFPQVSQCTELDFGRAFCVVLVCVCCITCSFLNASNASLVPRRRSWVCVVQSIYFQKVKNNMSQKRKRESIVCFTPISSKNYIETSKR